MNILHSDLYRLNRTIIVNTLNKINYDKNSFRLYHAL